MKKRLLILDLLGVVLHEKKPGQPFSYENCVLDQDFEETMNILHDRFDVVIMSNLVEEKKEEILRFPIAEHIIDLMLSDGSGIEKPDPEAFRLICERNNYQIEDAVFVDDYLSYIAVAKRLGMKGIWLAPGHKVAVNFTPDQTIQRLGELQRIL